MSCFEDLVMTEFDHNISSPLFQNKLGVFLDDKVNIYENKFIKNREYDIIIEGNVRLYNGIPLDKPLNIEIEHPRVTEAKIKEKHNPEYLLSFITENKMCINSIASTLFYSAVDFNKIKKSDFNNSNLLINKNQNELNQWIINRSVPNSLDNLLINKNSEYLTKHVNKFSLKVLDKISSFNYFYNNNSSEVLNDLIRKNVSFFFGDYLMNNYNVDLFFQPNNKLSNYFIRTNSENFFVNNDFIESLVKKGTLKKEFENCLRFDSKHNRTNLPNKYIKSICSNPITILSLSQQDITFFTSSNQINNIFIFNNEKNNIEKNCSIQKVVKIK